MSVKIIFMIKLVFVLMIFISSCTYQTSDYYSEVLNNIIRNTNNGSMDSNGRKEIIINEISRLTYKNKLKLLDELTVFEPSVLKGIKSDIRQEIDRQYKESLLK
tara:strand:- start:167 stop:478 length:312 start_codon:yes stop_codon:yes gene_type:complete